MTDNQVINGCHDVVYARHEGFQILPQVQDYTRKFSFPSKIPSLIGVQETFSLLF